jgi:hypothetical protein
MECTNGQPAGYRRHREQSNPNAASRDQNGANKNPLHHRGFYRPPSFSCKSPHDREPTSGLGPLSCSLRVITQALQGCAGGCKCRIFRGVSFPCLAACCTVLRSRWYQSGVNSIYSLNSRYRASLQVVLQDAGCRLRRGTKHFYRNASASSHI